MTETELNERIAEITENDTATERQEFRDKRAMRRYMQIHTPSVTEIILIHKFMYKRKQFRLHAISQIETAPDFIRTLPGMRLQFCYGINILCGGSGILGCE